MLDAIAPLLERQFGKIDLERAGIELHCPAGCTGQLPAGLLGLLLGEILGNRYKYTLDRPQYPDEIDVEAARNEMEEVDRAHPGPEGGGRRAYADAVMAECIPQGADLLDYGCGGPAHKSYYAGCRSIVGVDVNPHALMRMRAFYPDRTNHRLIWAPLGITEIEPESAGCALASAVMGYLPPSVGNTAAYGFAEWLGGKGRMLERSDHPGSFHYKFTLGEMRTLVASRGLRPLKSGRYVVKLPPSLRRRTNALYTRRAIQAADRLVNMIPGFATWNLVVAEKPR